MADGANALIVDLNQYKRNGTAYPFQEDEVTAVINRWAQNAVRQSKLPTVPRGTQQSKLHVAHRGTPPKHSTRVQIWQYMLTAIYTGIKDTQGSAIAYGVYVPREGGKHRTTINADISTELGWLVHVSDHASPHHHSGLAGMWRALQAQGYDPNSRLPAMVRAPSEVQAAMKLRMAHCHGMERPTRRLALLAAIAALQSTGHLVTQPLPSYTGDVNRARTLGYSVAPLTRTQLLRDGSYHSRTLEDVRRTGRPVTGDRTTWHAGMVGMLENLTRSSFFRDTPRSGLTSQASPSSLKDMNLNGIGSGAHFAHCGGGAAVEKEAHIPSNWGITSHMCNGYSAEHNCGHSRKHVISRGGKQATSNAVPSQFPKEWSGMIPPSLYLAAMASSGSTNPPSLHGRCAVHIGSGTGSMARALTLMGVFLIGIDIKSTADAGSGVEHITIVADYDTFEGRMGTLVENSMHGTGFRRADNDLIAFDADCATIVHGHKSRWI